MKGRPFDCPDCGETHLRCNPRQMDFVQRYDANGGNGAKAARDSGYSVRSAARMAIELLHKPHVRCALAVLRNDRHERLEIDAERVLSTVSEIAEADPADAYDLDGFLRPIHDVPEHLRRAIQALETKEHNAPCPTCGNDRHAVTVKMRFADRGKALALLAANTGAVEPESKLPTRIVIESPIQGDPGSAHPPQAVDQARVTADDGE